MPPRSRIHTRHFLLRFFLLLSSILICALLVSCGSPNTRYLLQLAPPPCEEGGDRSFDAPLLMLDDFTTMPGMDRTAVFIAQGNVIQPSTIWYWEGNPAEVMTQAVSDRLSCEGPYRISWPYVRAVDHVAVLRGRVREFSLASGDPSEFKVRMQVELWSADSRQLLADKTIIASAHAYELTPQSTAQAASQAVADATRELSEWLDATRALVLD